jgi:hypothetical protein
MMTIILYIKRLTFRMTETIPARSSWKGVNWKIFYTSWGGWTLDGFTAFIYAFVNVVTTEYLLKATGISLSYKDFFLEGHCQFPVDRYL